MNSKDPYLKLAHINSDEFIELDESKNSVNANSKLSLQDAEALENIRDKKQDRDERKKYASKIFRFLCSFTAVILSIVIFDSLPFNCLSQGIRFKL